METASEKKELFESMPVPKAVRVMAVPTIVSQLISMVYNIVDAFYIGRTGDAYKAAAVTLAFTLFVMTVAFANLFGIGGGGLVARLVGQGKDDEARLVAAFSFYGSVAVSALYALGVGLFMTPLLNLLGASEMTLRFARQYTGVVVVAGSVPIIASSTMAHLLRNTGYSRQASLGLSGGGLLNILLDPLFMFVLLPEGDEVLGAALATLLSNLVSFSYFLLTMKKVGRNAPLSMKLTDALALSGERKREVLRVGVPSAILPGLMDIANIVLNARMSAHGDLELAALGIVMKADRFPNAANIGICQGMLPIVAYNYSSGNRERMQETIRFGRKAGMLIAFGSMAVFVIFARPLVGIFLSLGKAPDPAAAAATLAFAAVFLRLRALGSPAQFLNYHSSYCLQAMGNAGSTLIHALARELAFYIPMQILMDLLWGPNGLVLSLLPGEALGGLLALWLLNRASKKKKQPA